MSEKSTMGGSSPFGFSERQVASVRDKVVGLLSVEDWEEGGDGVVDRGPGTLSAFFASSVLTMLFSSFLISNLWNFVWWRHAP